MPQYENAEDRGGTARRRKAIRQLENSWIEAGCPENFTIKWTKGVGVKRVMNAAALREKLDDLQHPERVKVRKMCGELELRRKRMKADHS